MKLNYIIKENEKYNNFIRQSINIFGSFENLDKCRVGDTKLNISAEDFRQLYFEMQAYASSNNLYL